MRVHTHYIQAIIDTKKPVSPPLDNIDNRWCSINMACNLVTTASSRRRRRWRSLLGRWCRCRTRCACCTRRITCSTLLSVVHLLLLLSSPRLEFGGIDVVAILCPINMSRSDWNIKRDKETGNTPISSISIGICPGWRTAARWRRGCTSIWWWWGLFSWRWRRRRGRRWGWCVTRICSILHLCLM
jgi:hypothetical protein